MRSVKRTYVITSIWGAREPGAARATGCSFSVRFPSSALADAGPIACSPARPRACRRARQARRKMAQILAALTMTIAISGCGRGKPASSEITAQAAAAQFRTSAPDPQGFVRLNGSELRHLLVGHRARNEPNGEPVQLFHTDGRVFTTLENVTTTDRYVIRDDAICDERPRGWMCRRIYRDQGGRLFQLNGRPSSALQPIYVD